MRVPLPHILTNTYYCISFTINHMVCIFFCWAQALLYMIFHFQFSNKQRCWRDFLYLLAICIFSLDKCLNHLPIFKLCYLSFNCWVVFLYLFWIHSLYHIYDLPLLSTFCRLSFCFPKVFFSIFSFFFFCVCVVILHSLWCLSSLKRDWTWAHRRERAKS